VSFFIDGTSKAVVSDVPYTFNWVTNNENIGSHIIKATSVDNDGATMSDDIIINIIQGGSAPITSFSANPTNGQEPLTVNFTDQSNNNPTSWLWNFGDGNTSSQQNPSHTYYNSGVYSVSLTATNNFGTDTDIKTNYITVTASNSFTDPRDGQTYVTVEIGTQTWFAENLNYSTSSSWCYENNSSNCVVYGRLYTWSEALTVCPNGWHLPSDDEWQILVDYLGGNSVAGGKLKEAGYTHWNSPNAGATNSSGFTALPGGIRSDIGGWHQINTQGRWWTSTGFSSQMAWRNTLSYNLESVSRFTENKGYGLSIRCIKD